MAHARLRRSDGVRSCHTVRRNSCSSMPRSALSPSRGARRSEEALMECRTGTNLIKSGYSKGLWASRSGFLSSNPAQWIASSSTPRHSGPGFLQPFLQAPPSPPSTPGRPRRTTIPTCWKGQRVDAERAHRAGDRLLDRGAGRFGPALRRRAVPDRLVQDLVARRGVLRLQRVCREGRNVTKPDDCGKPARYFRQARVRRTQRSLAKRNTVARS